MHYLIWPSTFNKIHTSYLSSCAFINKIVNTNILYETGLFVNSGLSGTGNLVRHNNIFIVSIQLVSEPTCSMNPITMHLISETITALINVVQAQELAEVETGK